MFIFEPQCHTLVTFFLNLPIITKVCQIVRQILKKTITTFKTAVIVKYKKYVKVILLHKASLIYVLFKPSWVCLFQS